MQFLRWSSLEKNGRVEMVKVGWTSLETLGKELSEPLQTLVDGGTLLTSP